MKCEHMSGCPKDAARYWPAGDQRLCTSHADEVDGISAEPVTIPLDASGEQPRGWVRLVDGELVLTWHQAGGSPIAHTRPLTRWERIKWRLLQRTPVP